MVVALFWPALHFDFINLDDPKCVYENEHVLQGLNFSSIAYAFGTFDLGNWMPLTWLSYELDTTLLGAAPVSFHATNLVLHAVAAGVLLVALYRFTRRLWPSVFVAAAFALHPLRLESVVWVAERKDVLSALFFALGLLAYASYAGKPGARRYLLVFACLLLGLLAKPMLVSFPFCLLLLDFWPLRRAGGDWPSLKARAWPLVREKLPLFALCALFAGLALWTQQSASAIAFSQRPEAGLARVLRVADNYGFYLEKFFWPACLQIEYPLAPLVSLRVVVTLALFLALTAAAIRFAFSAPWLAVGWIWFAGMLVPVIGWVPLGSAWVADRYSYLPCVGILLALTGFAAAVATRRRRLAPLLAGAAAAVTVALAVDTRAELPRWHNSLTLFTDALAKGPSYLAHSHLARHLETLGRGDEALLHWQAALRLAPNYPRARCNLGTCYACRKQWDLAVTNYLQALQLDPLHVEAHYNLALTFLAQGRRDQALPHLHESLRLRPGLAAAHSTLAQLLLEDGSLDEAEQHLEAALRTQTHNARLELRLADVLQRLGRTPQALGHYRHVLKLDPSSALACEHLAWILAAHPDAAFRNGSEAVRLANRACDLTCRTNVAALSTLAAAHAEAGQFDRALAVALRADQLARDAGNSGLTQLTAARVELFRSSQACREP